MLFVPVPFVVTLLLLVLFGRVLLETKDPASNPLFLALILIYAIPSFLIGLL